MIKKLFLFITILLTSVSSLYSQTGTIKGRVYNNINNEPVPFANILIDSTQTGALSDIDGNYEIKSLKPGIYNIVCATIGYKKVMFFEIQVTSAFSTTLDIPMEESSSNLKEIEIVASPFERSEESPLSMRTINAAEIYRNPGGNRDISKVIQILPGVASSASFRNDIIVRGGSPSENRFFLDGIEVPNINHFATQGSSGGPVGMINVNFIQEVNFLAGAFPANRGNALSSVIEFKQIEGNTDKLAGIFMVGSSDVGITLNSPMGKKSSFIFSARRSYLQFLFTALKLPFLPTYTDFQYKHTFRFNTKNKLNIIGLAAIDDFELNKAVNDGETDPETIERNDYILGNLPISTQWNYAIGANYTHYSKNSYQTVVLSRNVLNNESVKYENNIEVPENLILNYKSQEIENKLRLEHTYRKKGWKWNVGGGMQAVKYFNSTFNKKVIDGAVQTVDFNSTVNFEKFAIFTQLSKSVLKDRLAISFGIRTDFNNYSADMSNPLDQLSPRLSLSYILTPKLNASISVGRYFQLPAYTILGYRDNNENLVNQTNGVTYIQSDHIVGGFEYLPKASTKITVEAFHKRYANYPFSLNDSISLANLGSDFGVVGNEPVTSISSGKSYGIEFFFQQKLTKNWYGLLSYTWVRSEFEDKTGNLIPSSWDNQHVLNVTAGRKFKKNWEVGAKFRLLGGSPYTPINVPVSSLKTNWDVTNSGIPDYDRLNSERLPLAHGLDIRVDKKWYFEKWSLNAYFDIQNVYSFVAATPPYLDVYRDGNGSPIEDPANSNAYLTREIANSSGTVLPSIGIMIDF